MKVKQGILLVATAAVVVLSSRDLEASIMFSAARISFTQSGDIITPHIDAPVSVASFSQVPLLTTPGETVTFNDLQHSEKDGGTTASTFARFSGDTTRTFTSGSTMFSFDLLNGSFSTLEPSAGKPWVVQGSGTWHITGLADSFGFFDIRGSRNGSSFVINKFVTYNTIPENAATLSLFAIAIATLAACRRLIEVRSA